MKYDDLMPFVLPFAPHTPDETARHHLRQAAARFFGATRAWQAELDPLTTAAGREIYSLNLEDRTDLASLMLVSINGSTDVNIVNAGTAFAARNRRARFRVSTINRVDIRIEPVPDPGSSVIVLAALKPNITNSVEFPDEYAEFGESIADGALSTLLRLPGDDRDLKLAADRSQAFSDSVSTVGCVVSLGSSGGPIKAQGRFF